MTHNTSHSPWFGPLAALIGYLLAISPSSASNIQSHPDASGENRPVVGESANGIPVVDITSPGEDGVSHNVYQQLDVDKAGVVFNNGRRVSTSKLAGQIGANPALAGGTADLILNEVRAASPSQLAGYLEIGGDAADLVIANPAGITCNGCGFINAERAMLTTGRPSFDNERWTGLEVRDGRIRIEGDGMDASRTAEADLLARAVEINAGIWADDLDVTAGAGHYDRFGRLIGPINTDTSSPQWGIDTARLGGMYAGKIRLVANEHGVGVRNAGDVAAGPNGLSITADGKLVNSGTTTAAGTTALRAEGITNTGAIHAERRLSLDRVNTLDNREGRIAGQADITTDAGVIDNRDGEILAGDALTLTLDTSLRNGAGLLYGRHNLTLSTPLMTGEGLWLSDGDIKATIRGNHRHQGEIAAGRNLSLTVEGTLDNADRLTAAGQAGIEADEVNNLASSEITAGALEITAESDLENHGLIDGHEIRVAATTIENSADGRIYGDQLSVTAHHLLNLGNEGSAATLAARSQLRLATDELKNRNEALILSAGDMLIEGHDKAFVDHLLNEGASIEALGDLSITAGHIDNRNGGLVTAQVDEPTVYRQFVQPKGSHHRYPRSECHGIGGGQDDNYCNGYPGSFEDYTLFQFNETTSRTKVTKTDPATIRSGGDLHLTGGELMNEDSHVIAGGDLLADLDDLDNRATRGQDITRRVGTSRFTTVESCGLFGSDHCREWHGTSSYRPAPEYGTPYDLPTVTYIDKESTNPALSTIPGAAGTSPSKNPTLPKASLFHIQRGNPNTPLIETDPRFASYRHWYGSEAMLDALARDPAYTQKRLGDGFYEQSIVRQQIVEETGQRHLDGFADDEAQFRALIDAGISFGRDLDLAPGVHLSAEQLAQLTADIVWLEEETVAVDGKARQVLVPHLHLADEPTHLGGRQGLIAGMNLNLTVAGTATNRGNLAASDTLALSANRIENLGGKIRAGRTRLTAGTDIRQRGGTIRGQQALSLAAGRDITLEADTRKGENRVDASDFTRDHVVDRGRLGVTGNDGVLSVTAGRDIRLQAAEITHAGKGGSTTLAAGRDIELATATESRDEHIVWDPDNRLVQGNSREIGATIDTEGDLGLTAGRDLDARAANLDSTSGDVAIAAGNDIRLESGRATSHWEEAHRIETDGLLSSKVSTSLDSSTADRSVASTVGGDQVTLVAGRDVSIQGSHVISDRGTQVGAGGDVQLLADRDEQTRYHFHQKSRSGLFSNGGLSVTLGDQRISATDDLARQTTAPSNLASIDGGVTVRAGETYRQTGSDVLAPGGDIDIRAGRVEITEARETATSRHQREMEQSGLAVSLSSPVIDAGRSIQRMASAADRTDSGRMKALAAASAGLAGMDAYNRIDTGLALENGNVAQKAGGLEVSLSLGS
ncbi:MAG: filamentous hemagglutinin N-terminal domain-containing protein, partial [Pseudomonadota bacterium]